MNELEDAACLADRVDGRLAATGYDERKELDGLLAEARQIQEA